MDFGDIFVLTYINSLLCISMGSVCETVALVSPLRGRNFSRYLSDLLRYLVVAWLSIGFEFQKGGSGSGLGFRRGLSGDMVCGAQENRLYSACNTGHS